MAIQILGLRTVVYLVSDLVAARDWYSNVFAVTPYLDTPYYVGFNIGGYELGLHPEDEGPSRKGDSVLTYWGTNDIETAYQRMISLGATHHQKPTNVGGAIVVASATDLWGNIIGLIYNPEFQLS